MKMFNGIKTFGGKVAAGAKKVGTKYGPTGLTIAGGVLLVGAIGYAIYATAAKAPEAAEKAKDKVEELHENEDHTIKDTVKTYTDIGVSFIGIYWPVALMGTGSVLSFLAANGLLKKELAVTAGALNVVTKEFSEYRGRVIADQGEEADRKYRFGDQKETVTHEEVDKETGEIKEVTEEASVVDLDEIRKSPYMFVFDKNCRGYDSHIDYMRHFLTFTQNSYNDKLQTEGHIFLDDILTYLHIKPTKVSHNAGWVKDQGDNYIDFRLHECFDRAREDIREHREPVFILDFNCQGRIDNIVWEK